MSEKMHIRSTVSTWGVFFLIANLLLLIGQVYWIWRYASNHYLCMAAVSDDLNTAEIALGLGASPNYRLPTGETPLTLARRPFMVKTLLSAGADPNVRNDIGATPLFIAVERGDKAAARILLEHGAAVNAATDSGVPPS
jgi:ankyrin repeat protein